jgi:hypothetical protein
LARGSTPLCATVGSEDMDGRVKPGQGNVLEITV